VTYAGGQAHEQKYHPILGIIQNLTPEVINTDYLTTRFTMIYENILSQLI